MGRCPVSMIAVIIPSERHVEMLMMTVFFFFVCVVFSQGDKGTSWYIIWKGSVNVITHGKVNPSTASK